MKQVELCRPRDVRVIDSREPAAEPDELVIAVARAGICGSDLHAYHGRHPCIALPVLPGHEFAGTVVQVGDQVRGFSVGQRVTVEPSLVCGTCFQCTHGRYNICEQLRTIGCQTPGAMAEFIAVPASKTYPLPDNVDWEQATMTEPLAVAVRAVRAAQLRPGAKVLIMGAGTIGLLTMQAALASGANSVIIADLIDARLKLAVKLGAADIVNAATADVRSVVEDVFGEPRADVVFDCSGAPAAVREAIRTARSGTRVILAGIYCEEIAVEIAQVELRELTLVGSLMYVRDDFRTALSMIEKDTVRPSSLITHRYRLHEAAEAFATADNPAESVKVMLLPKP
jgi:L-iditol 2-dehydrogenase